MRTKVKVKRLSETAQLPKYAHESDGCCDLYADSANMTDDYIEYGTGIALDIPEGYDVLVFARSSISKYDLELANAVPYIDNGYKGEIKLRFKLIRNPLIEHPIDENPKIYRIGDRIGQMRLIERNQMEFEEVDSLSDSDRGEGGFGSSGTN